MTVFMCNLPKDRQMHMMKSNISISPEIVTYMNKNSYFQPYLIHRYLTYKFITIKECDLIRFLVADYFTNSCSTDKKAISTKMTVDVFKP